MAIAPACGGNVGPGDAFSAYCHAVGDALGDQPPPLADRALDPR
ncbi:MAG TPA: hypothetical protein VKB57_14340 [Acidimicrobiales bacterium]|nr:hypothetical protein [Acidimicrobiales bacterium]